MKPLPRQKIYKFSVFKNLIDFFTFGILNYNKHKEIKKIFNGFFNTQNILCLNRGELGHILQSKPL